MKKTIFLMALGLGSLCLTSCSKGYGCPYGVEMKIQNPKMNKLETTESQLVVDEVENPAIENMAD